MVMANDTVEALFGRGGYPLAKREDSTHAFQGTNQPRCCFNTQHVTQRHSHCNDEQRIAECQVGQAYCTHVNRVVPDGRSVLRAGLHLSRRNWQLITSHRHWLRTLRV